MFAGNAGVAQAARHTAGSKAERRQQGRAQAARQSAGSKAERRQQGRAQGGKREAALAAYTQRASKAGGKRSLSIQRKEVVEAVAPALARGWLRQGLGRSTMILSTSRPSQPCLITFSQSGDNTHCFTSINCIIFLSVTF
jgi:hypothetical protein